MPLDIFIPFWGDPKYLQEALDSVRSQENGDWLLTVIDDAYPDETIPDYFAALGDPRVTYIRKPRNEGITENFRACVSLAKQDRMIILGCDDVLLPNYVDIVLAAHNRFPQVAIIQPGVQVINEDGIQCSPLADVVKQRIVKPASRGQRILSGEALATSLMHGDWLYWPSLAFRTDKIRSVRFRDGFPVALDLALVMDLIFQGEQLLVEPTVCFSYRRHSASLSSRESTDGLRFEQERAYFAFAGELASKLGWERAALAARRRLTSRLHALSLVPMAIASGRLSAAQGLLRHSFGR